MSIRLSRRLALRLALTLLFPSVLLLAAPDDADAQRRAMRPRRPSVGRVRSVTALNLTGEFNGSVVYPDGNMRGENARLVIEEQAERSSPAQYVGRFTLTLGNAVKQGTITASKWEPGKSGGVVTIDGVEIRVRPNPQASDPPRLRLLNKKGEPRCFRFCPPRDRSCIYPPRRPCNKYVPPRQ